MDKLSFLKSRRFWAIISGAFVIYFEQKGFIGEAERNLLETMIAGFVALETVRKFQ